MQLFSVLHLQSAKSLFAVKSNTDLKARKGMLTDTANRNKSQYLHKAFGVLDYQHCLNTSRSVEYEPSCNE